MERCDCGHKPTATDGPGCGYGTGADGLTYCYTCCTERDRAELATASRMVHYVNGSGDRLINWPGDVLGRVLHWGSFHPWSRERRYVRVLDVHGQEWYGTAAPGMWASLRKARD